MRADEPITGLAYDPDDPYFLDDPYPWYGWLRDEAPVHLHPASGTYLISRFEDVWDATAAWQLFSSESPVTANKHFASMDPPDHDRLRSAVASWLTPGRVARLEPRIRALCDELLGPLEGDAEIELVGAFASRFPSRVIQAILGIPDSEAEEFRIRALRLGTSPDAQSMAESMEALEELSRQLIRTPDALDERGLLFALRSARPEHGLSPDEIVGICTNLVLAGTDTVTNLISNAVVLLHRHPEARRRLLEDPSRIPRAVEEVLRFESPVQSLARRATADTRLRGVDIPRGAELRLMWGAANRDEREFEHADRFDVKRKLPRHLALGHGIHFCVGAALARLEARVALDELLTRWPRLEVDEAELVRLRSFWLRSWECVPLRTYVA